MPVSSRPARFTRPAVALAAGTLLAALLGGCATGGAASGGAADEPAAAGAPSAFPIEIESALGTAVIEAQPTRVVTIGQGSADTVFALGTTPVGVETDDWGGDTDGFQPWFREAVEEAGETLPATFDVYPEVDIDAIVQLEPDLILAPQSGLTQADFDVLNDLAPTVAFPGQAWSTAWDEQIEIIGRALGEPAAATTLIEGIEATLATAAADNPGFAELTFAYVYTGDPGTLGVFQASEPRAAILEKLGLRIDPVIADLPVTDGTASSIIGIERADLLADTDLLFSWFSDDAQQETIEAQPLYAQIPAVQRGSDVVSYDKPFVTASSLITPLTVPWSLDTYLPMIRDAAARVQ